MSRSIAAQADGRWWRCKLPAQPDPQRCVTGPVEQLQLTQDELAFVQTKLNRIAWYPKPAARADVEQVLGKPSKDLSNQYFEGIGPGADPNRGVVVHYRQGYVFSISWFVPDKFALLKTASDEQLNSFVPKR